MHTTGNKPKIAKKKAKKPTVGIRLTEVRKGVFGNEYEIWIPGFGNTGCTVLAKNANAAKKVVAEFVGNELMNAKELIS